MSDLRKIVLPPTCSPENTPTGDDRKKRPLGRSATVRAPPVRGTRTGRTVSDPKGKKVADRDILTTESGGMKSKTGTSQVLVLDDLGRLAQLLGQSNQIAMRRFSTLTMLRIIGIIAGHAWTCIG
jgi:hypothetical protein